MNNEAYTFEQFCGALSWIVYGDSYEGRRWVRQGEQGRCRWDRKTKEYIDTEELYQRMIRALMDDYTQDWTAM